jgi:hypothetical protein
MVLVNQAFTWRYKVKCKVVLVLFVTEHNVMKEYWGVEV